MIHWLWFLLLPLDEVNVSQFTYLLVVLLVVNGGTVCRWMRELKCGEREKEAEPLAGGPPTKNPTLFLLTPSFSWRRMTSDPRNPPSSFLLLPMHQVRPASTGDSSSFRS